MNYYTIPDTITILQKINPMFGINELAAYAQEKIIHPVIYINSLATFAGSFEEGEFYVYGYCRLTAYVDIKN